MKLPERISSSKPHLKIPKRKRATKGIDRDALGAALSSRHEEGGPQLRRDVLDIITVSYTHLTLPTILLV